MIKYCGLMAYNQLNVVLYNCMHAYTLSLSSVPYADIVIVRTLHISHENLL